MSLFAIVVLLVLAVVAAVVAYRARQQNHDLRQKYAPILDIDGAVAAAQRELDRLHAEHAAFVDTDRTRRAELEATYKAGLATFETLQKDIALLEEHAEDISYGLYEPHFDLASSDEYKFRLLDIRGRQKTMVRNGTAATAAKVWQVGGNAKEGARMTKQYLKILLRAFNAECDAAVAIVSWKNVTQMEARIEKSLETVNTLGSVMEMSIAREYLGLKLDELRLTHEYENKRYQEREEQRQIREQMREEEKAQRELERAREEAEREEARFEKALQKARQEAATASGEQLASLNATIEALQNQLEQAHQQKERATSQAQLTKSGHVYVVSNVGAFGERVFKIGMTRRLEPAQRITELGDASVPFPFDVHAMIYADNARDLEGVLHAAFADDRLNLVNMRKEFFAVSLERIDSVVQKFGLTIEFTKLAEAREYRETVSIRDRRTATPPPADTSHPQALFGTETEA